MQPMLLSYGVIQSIAKQFSIVIFIIFETLPRLNYAHSLKALPSSFPFSLRL
jgi:hypothetical protein